MLIADLLAFKRAVPICRVPVTVLFGCVLVQPGQAVAVSDYTQMDLEQLLDVEIITASKYSQKQSESASSVTVIDKRQIKQFGYRTLGDALRAVPGFFITNDHLYENAGVRGFDQAADYNGRMLVMIDGIRTNETIYDSAFLGNELPIDIDLLERIEVVRGPGSSMYGSNAFFAVVNLITRNGSDYQGGELSGSWSSFDSYKGRLSYGRKHDNGLEYLVSVNAFASDGPSLGFQQAGRDTNPVVMTDALDDKNRQFFAKAGWGNFSFEGGYGYRLRHMGGGIYGTSTNDGRTYSDEKVAFANLQYDDTLLPNLDFTFRAFYGDYDLDARYQYGTVPNVSQPHATWSGFETRLVSTQIEGHKIVAGIEVQENWLQHQINFDAAPAYYLYSLDDRDSHRIGVYLQDDIALTEQLRLSLGARMDDYSLVSSALFSPRLGLIYHPWDDTTLRVQYGQAFRAANAAQYFQAYAPSYAEDGSLSYSGLQANPNLQPEQIETYELGLEQNLPQNWRFNATGYYMQLEKLIAYRDAGTDYLQHINAENSQHGYGGEFELRRQWDNGLSLRTAYSVFFAEDHAGRSLHYLPRHIYQLNLMTPLFNQQWHGGIELQALSNRQTEAGRLPSYTRLNLSLLYQPVSNLDVSATVYDLIDNYTCDPGDLGGFRRMPQMGRTFRLKLDFRF